MSNTSGNTQLEFPLPYRFSVIAIATCLAIIIIYTFPSIASLYGEMDEEFNRRYYNAAFAISVFLAITLFQSYPSVARRRIRFFIRMQARMTPGFRIDHDIGPLEPQQRAVRDGSQGGPIQVTLVVRRALMIGKLPEYDIGLDNARLGRTTYSRGITIDFTVNPGHHELEIRQVSSIAYQAFDLDFPERGHYRVEVVMGWWGYWRRPTITWQA